MSTAADLELLPITQEHGGALAAFRCATVDAPWTVPVEEYVRRLLISELASGRVDAVGLWEGEVLAAVVVWRMETAVPTCSCFYLATGLGFRARGCARRLKEWLVTLAGARDRLAVTSRVHQRNEVMLGLNTRLGAEFEPPNEDGYLPCTIRLVGPAQSSA